MTLSKYLSTILIISCLVIGNSTIAVADGGGHEHKKADIQLTSEGEGIVTFLEEYAVAQQSKDIVAIEKFVMTDDSFTSLEGTYEDIGWASYRKHLTDELPLFNDYSYELTNIRPTVMGNVAYATMDYDTKITVLSDQFEGGKHLLTLRGKATIILVKNNGMWKISHMHTASKKSKKPDAQNDTQMNPH